MPASRYGGIRGPEKHTMDTLVRGEREREISYSAYYKLGSEGMHTRSLSTPCYTTQAPELNKRSFLKKTLLLYSEVLRGDKDVLPFCHPFVPLLFGENPHSG